MTYHTVFLTLINLTRNGKPRYTFFKKLKNQYDMSLLEVDNIQAVETGVIKLI